MPQRSTPPLTIPPMRAEGIIGRKLVAGTIPERLTVIRLHAFGDAVIALPLLAGLRRMFPRAEITFITSELYRELFEGVTTIDRVVPFPTGASKVRRAAAAAMLAPRLGSPDLLLDIQRSTVSLLIGSLMRPTAWAGFDRYGPFSALDRYLEAARWIGLDGIEPEYSVSIRAGLAPRADALLSGNRASVDFAQNKRTLVCLNPAGCWPTKHWPAKSYVGLGKRLIEEWGARIVLIGTDNVRTGAAAIAAGLAQELGAAYGDHVIDLVGRTTTAEALALMSRIDLMVSDDSGLMHLAWTSGVPTIGLFGASRSVWSRPMGPHSFVYASEDLECGACMSPVCARGDLLCLERVTVEEVAARCGEMVRR